MNTEFGIEKAKKERRVWLTERDAKILKFILDMKFASRSEVYEKFFKVNKDGTPSVSEHWAKERIGLLCKAGLLRREMVYRESKSYYQATKFAARWLEGNASSDYICKPAKEIDFRNFEHDKILLQCRLRLEKIYPASIWISDKELNENDIYTSAISDKDYRPDGLVLTADGKKIAFELELTTKSKRRYQDKIDFYLYNHHRKQPKNYFDKVIYVCSKKFLFKTLVYWTNAYGGFFEIEMMSQFLQN